MTWLRIRAQKESFTGAATFLDSMTEFKLHVQRSALCLSMLNAWCSQLVQPVYVVSWEKRLAPEIHFCKSCACAWNNWLLARSARSRSWIMATFKGVSLIARSFLTRGVQARLKCTLKVPTPVSLVKGGWSTSTPVGGKDGYLPTPEPLAAPVLKRPDFLADATERTLEPSEYKYGMEKAEYDGMLLGVEDMVGDRGCRKHWGTMEDPVLIPSTETEKLIQCFCDGDTELSENMWTLYVGRPQRCPCGCVYKLFPVDRLAKIEYRHWREYSFTSPFKNCGVCWAERRTIYDLPGQEGRHAVHSPHINRYFYFVLLLPCLRSIQWRFSLSAVLNILFAVIVIIYYVFGLCVDFFVVFSCHWIPQKYSSGGTARSRTCVICWSWKLSEKALSMLLFSYPVDFLWPLLEVVRLLQGI